VNGLSGLVVPAGVYDCGFDPSAPPVVNVQLITGGTVCLAQIPGECTVTLLDDAVLGEPISGSFSATAASATGSLDVSGTFSFSSTQ
jgi:hypothetical protein